MFKSSHGYADGEQRRDFIHVSDVVNVNLHFWRRPAPGVYNVGTGRAQSFNDVAVAVINTARAPSGESPLAAEPREAASDRVHPVSRQAGQYQAFTQADLTQLRAAGCDLSFQPVEEGTASYARLLAQQPVTLRRAAFLDRDGVINIDRGYVYRPEEFEFVDGVFEGTSTLQRLGFVLIIISNQSGIGRGLYSEADLDVLNHWMLRQFEQRSIRIEGVFHCPHHPTEAIGRYRRDCDCRKPAPGMLLQAARD